MKTNLKSIYVVPELLTRHLHHYRFAHKPTQSLQSTLIHVQVKTPTKSSGMWCKRNTHMHMIFL